MGTEPSSASHMGSLKVLLGPVSSMAVLDALEFATVALDTQTVVGIAVVTDRTVAFRQTALAATSGVRQAGLDKLEMVVVVEHLGFDMVD